MNYVLNSFYAKVKFVDYLVNLILIDFTIILFMINKVFVIIKVTILVYFIS